jgi:hypothetical protein
VAGATDGSRRVIVSRLLGCTHPDRLLFPLMAADDVWVVRTWGPTITSGFPTIQELSRVC